MIGETQGNGVGVLVIYEEISLKTQGYNQKKGTLIMVWI